MKLYEIKATLKRKIGEGRVLIQIVWTTKAQSMAQALDKASIYAAIAQSEEDAVCEDITVMEVSDV